MAFRLPNQPLSRPQPQHQHQQEQSYTDAGRPSSPPFSPTSLLQDEDDSKEWVLFSPTQPLSTASTTARHARTTSTERTPRLSDFGSFGFPARSSVGQDETHDHDLIEGDEEEEEEEEEEGTELDSLDDGLHAFREPSVYGNERAAGGRELDQSDPAMLPTHDGLGTFPASSMHVQEQLWQHERFNPRRKSDMRHRRRSSVQRHLEGGGSDVDERPSRDMDQDRYQRIEKWRMEQSKALLQEIEKETTRRRRTSLSGSRTAERHRALPRLTTSEVMGDVSTDTPEDLPTHQEPEESFWRRITRRVIRDLIGLDDSILSVILGESLVPIEEESGNAQDQESESTSQQTAEGHAKKRKASTILEPDLPDEMDDMLKNVTAQHQGDAWWQEKLLDRIARELGNLVHQICEDPSAFSTYLRAPPSLSSPSQDYAGIPTTRFNYSTPTPSSPVSRRRQPFPSRARTLSSSTSGNMPSTHSPNFAPTLQDPAANTARQSTPWAVESGQQPQPASHSSSREPISEPARMERETEYWERELDLGMIFQYLRGRLAGKIPFTTARNSTTPASSSSHRHGGASNPAHRAAIIRHHHPLVARAHDRARAQWQFYSNSAAAGGGGEGVGGTGGRAAGRASSSPSPLRYRRTGRSSSSCASQSTRLSAVSTKKTLASGSSRNYWDIGGSVGSGSAVAPVGGGMGSWGDV